MKGIGAGPGGSPFRFQTKFQNPKRIIRKKSRIKMSILLVEIGNIGNKVKEAKR
jgi:hypothetical protein